MKYFLFFLIVFLPFHVQAEEEKTTFDDGFCFAIGETIQNFQFSKSENQPDLKWEDIKLDSCKKKNLEFVEKIDFEKNSKEALAKYEERKNWYAQAYCDSKSPFGAIPHGWKISLSVIYKDNQKETSLIQCK